MFKKTLKLYMLFYYVSTKGINYYDNEFTTLYKWTIMTLENGDMCVRPFAAMSQNIIYYY